MNIRNTIIAAAMALAFSAMGQSGAPATTQGSEQPQAAQDQSRDLTYKKNEPPKTDVPSASAAAPHIPRSYALVIGISKYRNLPAQAQLQYPDVDAESVYTVLISPEGGQFPAENVHKLINEKATAANIRQELEQWLPSVTHPDDRVLIYFAGHGFVSNATAYIAPYDIDLAN